MSNSRRTAAHICFTISVVAIVAMFITAAAIKNRSWTVIEWIIEYFWYGYFAFILGAIIFFVVGVVCLNASEQTAVPAAAVKAPDSVKFSFNGFNSDLYVYDNKVVIIGKGYNKAIGEKSIPMTSVSAVQFVPSNGLANGYISFNVLGEVASSRGGIGAGYNARQSENTVIARAPADDEVLRRIKHYIEQARGTASYNQGATIIQQAVSPAEELKKMKELLDMGIITQEEFDAKKKQLLGL